MLLISDHMERLKTKLAAMNHNTTNLHAVVAEVIAPEVAAHPMIDDLGIHPSTTMKRSIV
jgi:hypothetical protein